MMFNVKKFLVMLTLPFFLLFIIFIYIFDFGINSKQLYTQKIIDFYFLNNPNFVFYYCTTSEKEKQIKKIITK